MEEIQLNEIDKFDLTSCYNIIAERLDKYQKETCDITNVDFYSHNRNNNEIKDAEEYIIQYRLVHYSRATSEEVPFSYLKVIIPIT